MMKRSLFLCVMFACALTQVQASCRWGYTNALTVEVSQAQALLKDYAICRGECGTLENQLKQRVVQITQAKACPAQIYTRANKEMINFIAGRFKLIQKQKQGAGWGNATAAKTTVPSVSTESRSTLVMDKPAFIPPKPVAKVPDTAKPTVQTERIPASEMAPTPTAIGRTATAPKSVQGQTKMRITRDAYAALWDAPTPTPRQQQAPQTNRKPAANQQLLRQKQLAQQRLIQQRKQALIKQKRLQLIRAKQQAMQKHLHHQRLKRQRLLQQRALARQLNYKRMQQRKAAIARRNAR